jgi:predicted ester cyclase
MADSLQALLLRANGDELGGNLLMKMDPCELRDFAERYSAAWCSQDPASVAAFFSLGGSLKVNDLSPATGRAAIAEVARAFMAAFPDLRLGMDDLIIENDRVIYHWTFSGHHAGPGGTGNQVRFSGFEDWKFGSDKLIAESLGHFNEREYEHQLTNGI